MNHHSDLQLINRYRQALMGVAALWIFLFHETKFQTVTLPYVPQYVNTAFSIFKRIGFCGVDIFLFLSGIGLLYAIDKYSLGTFYKRRVSRVFLPFLLTGICQCLYFRWSLPTLLKKVFLYDFLFVNAASFLWFVPAILILYLCFPLYYKVFLRFKNKLLFTGLVLALWAVISVSLIGKLRFELFSVTNRLPIFLLGILVGWWLREKRLDHFPILVWPVLLLVFCVGLYLSFLTNYRDLYLLVPISNCCIPNLLMASSGTCLLAKLFSYVDRVRPGKLLLKLLAFFGGISLEIYCMQEWLDPIVRPLLCHLSKNPWLLNLGVFLIVLGAALLLHKLCSLLLGRKQHTPSPC